MTKILCQTVSNCFRDNGFIENDNKEILKSF